MGGYGVPVTLVAFFNIFHFYHFTGSHHVITDVIVYNRGDDAANTVNRAQNLRVGVTDVQPQEGVDINPNSYTLCGDKDGKV